MLQGAGQPFGHSQESFHDAASIAVMQSLRCWRRRAPYSRRASCARRRLSQSPDPHRRAGGAGRRRRHLRAPDRGQGQDPARRAVHRREPHRRQLDDRRPRCAARRAGRLHGAVPRLDAQRRAAGAEECALRSGRRFHADRARRRARRWCTSSPTTGRRRRWPRSSPRPRPTPTSGPSRPRSSARPAISPPWRSINTPALNLPIIPYRGTAPAANDVVGGHVPMMIEAILSLLPMVRAGSVRAVAVTSTKRSSLAPEIPTMAEVGLPAAQLRRLVGHVGTARHAGRSDQDDQRLGQRGGQGAGRRGPSRRARHRAVGGDPAGLREVHRRRTSTAAPSC